MNIDIQKGDWEFGVSLIAEVEQFAVRYRWELCHSDACPERATGQHLGQILDKVMVCHTHFLPEPY